MTNLQRNPFSFSRCGRQPSFQRVPLANLARIGILFLALTATVGCQKSSKSKAAAKSSPAKVEKLPSETDAYQITLTTKAVERLDISTDTVREETVQRHRTFGGDIQIPPGNSVIVTAPVAGTLRLANQNKTPRPGETITAGRSIFTFVPMLSPERDVPTPAELVAMANARASLLSAQIIAAGDVKQAEAEVVAAMIVLKRAEELHNSKAGSRKDVDDAKATLNLAEQKQKAAGARKKTLDELTLNMKAGKVTPFDITAPEHGMLRTLSVAKGQTVTAGTALFEIVKLDTVWIRVPVYVEQFDEVSQRGFAEITGLGRVAKVFIVPIHRIVIPKDSEKQIESAVVQRQTDEIRKHGQKIPIPVRWDEETQRWIVVLTGKSEQDQEVLTTFPACKAAGIKDVRCRVFAAPVTAPPTADPLASTVDLYFRVPNPLGTSERPQRWFRPGERVGATVPIDANTRSLVVKAGAILRDINGTAWVYERTSATTFRRRRVQVRYVVGNLAVLASGPTPGTKVVVDGAAELFGTEFGGGK